MMLGIDGAKTLQVGTVRTEACRHVLYQETGGFVLQTAVLVVFQHLFQFRTVIPGTVQGIVQLRGLATRGHQNAAE